MAAHMCLKNESTEGKKYHNLMRWLKYLYEGDLENDDTAESMFLKDVARGVETSFPKHPKQKHKS